MRVLVVEDERRLAAGLRNGLAAEGFAVDVALDGTDGLWMAREHPYDVIVLDIMLPGVNGYRCARPCAATASGPRSSC
jgi:two-component system, OmpR family, response regulator